MRYSVIGLLGTALVGMLVGCGDDATDAPDSPSGGTGAAAGKAGSGGSKASGGKGGTAAGKGGSSTAGSGNATGGKGGSSNGKGGSSNSKGGSSTTGGTGNGTGSSSAGTTASDGGTAGTVVIPSTGGSSGEAGAGGAAAGASGADNGGNDSGLAGASPGGNAGADMGGAAGATSSCQVQCASTCVDPSVRTVDQSYLDETNYVGLDTNSKPGEWFTVGRDGTLTGIEVTIASCGGEPDTSLSVQLELFDDQGTVLGHAKLPVTAFIDGCVPPPLAADSIGAGYFDLTPLCVSAVAGQTLGFILTITGDQPITCDGGTCSNNSGQSCEDPSDCSGQYRAGFTDCNGGCSPADYAGGSYVQGNGGYLHTYPQYETVFKTFMQ